MIEAFFSRLKHGWLYLNELRDFATLEKFVGFYIAEHNSAMPHAAFHGPTPDEIYFSRGDAILEQTAEGKRLTRQDRIIKNRSRSCDICPRSSGVAPQIGEPTTPKT